MRVLYVIPGPVYGGAHNQVVQLRSGLEAKGVQSVVLLPSEDGDAFRRLQAQGVEVYRTTLKRLRSSRSVKQHVSFALSVQPQVAFYQRVFEMLEVDVVQIHGITQLDPALAARRAGVPLIWQLLDTRAPRPLMRAMRPALVALPQVIMTTGRAVGLAHLGNRKARAPILDYYPPVRSDLVVFKGEERHRIRKLLGVNGESLLVCSIGNLNPQKGHDRLIRAVASLGSRVELRIRGAVSPQHPGYASYLRDLAAESGLSKLTVGQFDGEIQVPSMLAASDVFALASERRSEGLPTVILEAMSVGLPIVTTAAGSVRDAVSDGVNGYVVKSSSPRAFAAALGRLVKDEGLRTKFGLASRAKAAAEYTLEGCLNANLEAISLARGPGRAAGD